MASGRIRPIIGIPASTVIPETMRMKQYQSGSRTLEAALALSGCIPIVIPGLIHQADGGVEAILDMIDGLLLPGGRANIEPHHYEGEPFPDDEVRDPERDAVVLPLVRGCVEAGVPVFGICRGIQEMNVALGGSLHYRLHLLPDKMDHRMIREGPSEQRMGPRHPIELNPEGMFAAMTGETEFQVNSLHGQGVNQLGKGLVVEAIAPDGVIEGIRHDTARSFTVGVQYHAEWQYDQHPLSKTLFEEFGKAAQTRLSRRRSQVATS